MRKLPKITEMEHITSKEFGENMDAIVMTVSAENGKRLDLRFGVMLLY